MWRFKTREYVKDFFDFSIGSNERLSFARVEYPYRCVLKPSNDGRGDDTRRDIVRDGDVTLHGDSKSEEGEEEDG